MNLAVQESTSVQSRLVDSFKIATTNDDEDLGEFFERLAELVPKCEYMFAGCPKLTNPNNFNHQHQPNLSPADALGSSVQHYPCKCMNIPCLQEDTCVNDRLGCDEQYHVPKPTMLSTSECSCTDNNDYSSNYSKTNNIIKSKRSRHNRTVPYRISKTDERNSRKLYDVNSRKSSNKKQHESSDQSSTSSSEVTNGLPAVQGEEQLELLTDVIEYISNLQRILDDSPNNNFIKSSGTTVESQESVKSDCRGLESGSFRESSAPVDRAMELLEYKTGTITLTA